MHSFESIDLHRLHQTIDRLDQRPVRGEGRSYAFLALMVGESHLGDPGNTYLYVGETEEWARRVANKLAEILQDEEFSVKVHNTQPRATVFVMDNDKFVKTFWFVGVDSVERCDIMGMVYADIYVDVSAERMESMDSELWERLQTRIREQYLEDVNAKD